MDFSGKKVSTKSGKTYDYTKLVLATGGTPRWLPLEGLKQGALENVFVLRALPDVQGILKAAGDNGKKVVVIGSSFIGMEVGNCLAGMKNDVSIIGMESGKHNSRASSPGIVLILYRAHGARNGNQGWKDFPRTA